MSIRDLLEAKAHALAEEMATAPTVLHLQAAAHHLTVELRRELDTLIADFRPAGAEVKRETAPAPAEAPAAEAAQSDAAAPPTAAIEQAGPAIVEPAAAAEVAS